MGRIVLLDVERNFDRSGTHQSARRKCRILRKFVTEEADDSLKEGAMWDEGFMAQAREITQPAFTVWRNGKIVKN